MKDGNRIRGNRFFPKALFLLVILALLTARPPAIGAEEMMDKWSSLHSSLEKAVALLEKKRVAPDASWVPFKEDKQSLDADIADLLDDALEVLNISDLTAVKKEIRECQERIQSCRRTISELQTKKLMAPEEVAAWKIWKSDIEGYEKKIESYKATIADNQNRIEALKKDFAERISSIGIELDQTQIDTLIYSVTGDDDVGMIAVFNNIKILTEKLKTLAQDSSENIETARRYYGMHVILLKTLLRLQQGYIDRIDGAYVPMLDRIADENRRLMAETEALLERAESRHSAQYQANMAAQSVTADTVELYRRYLQRNRDRVSASQAKVVKEYEIAENTYHTVSTAYALMEVMRNADRFFNALDQLQVPDLLTFDNSQMRDEFRKLTERMGSGNG